MHKLAARAPPRGVWCPEVLERAQCACWCLGELYKRASLRRTCSTIVEVVDTKCEHGRRRRVLYGWAAQQVQGVRRCIAAAQRPLRARAGAQQVQGLWRQLHLRARAAACAKAVIRSIIY
jgi:hypothetical protein